MDPRARRLVRLATAGCLAVMGIAWFLRGSFPRQGETIRLRDEAIARGGSTRTVREASPPEGEPASAPTIEGVRQIVHSVSLEPGEGGISGQVIEAGPGDPITGFPGSAAMVGRFLVNHTASEEFQHLSDGLDIPGREAVPDGRGTGAVERNRGAPVTRFTVRTTRVLEPGGRAAVAEAPSLHSFQDDRGAFEIRGMKPGWYALTTDAPGFHPSPAALVEVRDGEWTRDLEFSLDRVVVVSGRVVDGESGRPVSGALLKVGPNFFHDSVPGPLPQATSGPDGEFLLTLPPGRGFPIRASCEGYLEGFSAFGELMALRGDECTFRLRRAGAIDGFAIAPDGRTMGRAVWVRPPDAVGAYSRVEPLRNDGYFRFPGLAPGRYSVGLEFEPIADAAGGGTLRSPPPLVIAVTVETGRTARIEFPTARRSP